MIKKANVFLILTVFLLILPIQTFASGMTREYDPPSNSDYYQKKISYQLYFSPGVAKVRITQYKYGADQTDPTSIVTQKIWNVSPNSYMWVDMTCKGATGYEYLDSSSNVVDMNTRGQTDVYLNSGTCDSNSIAPSDFNETQNQYASDTFGGTTTKLSNPPTADGSGGTGTTGYQGDGSGTSTGGSTTDPGTSGGTTTCTACEMFTCPGWSDYMNKLNQIVSAIPPAPNWDDVAGKFRDTIVPQLVNDMAGVIGSAPNEPSTPSQLLGTDDRGINNQVPQMQDVPGLSGSGFSSQTIKDAAPVIQERQDPTGGFNLVQDPLSSLPSLPTNDFPKPGSTNAGDWGNNKPSQPDNPTPAAPKDTGGTDTSNAPIPSDSGATAPSPGDTGGTAPTPGDAGGTVPAPSGDTYPGMKDYKPGPDSPDGSGGDISP
ncbi:MAG: hypothetical protein Q8934_15560 [Bacillota bacterium]|nr:hypothetical protein [Bacillota bacterium]